MKDSFPEFYLNLLRIFDKYDVHYLVVGGYATNYHGVIRNTIDLDLWVDNNDDNRNKIYNSFISIGYDEKNTSQALQALMNDHMIRIPVEDHLVEIMDKVRCRLNFNQVYKRRIETMIQDTMFRIISLGDLIDMKSRSNRYRDLIDAKELAKFRDHEDK